MIGFVLKKSRPAAFAASCLFKSHRLAGLFLLLPINAYGTTIGGVTAYYPANGTSGPSKSVESIDVTASVGNRCGFAADGIPAGAVSVGALDTQSWSGRVSFLSECNGAWRVAVSSENGALQAVSASAVDGFAYRAPYIVSLHVVQDSGATVTGTCAAGQIQAGDPGAQCGFGGVASAANGLLIGRSFDVPGSYLEISAPAYAGPGRLVAGIYRDTLTITVSAAT